MRESLKLLKRGFESNCYETQEFRTFFKTFRREFTKELKAHEVKDIVFNKGHFSIWGFYTTKWGAVYYFSLSDVRGSELGPMKLLYRRADDYKDYTGGANQWVDIKTGMSRQMNLD